MKEWLETGTHQVNAFLQIDPDYKELLEQTEAAEAKYDKVMKKLSPADQEIVEEYIALCEDLEHQRTIAAWYCGIFHASQGT